MPDLPKYKAKLWDAAGETAQVVFVWKTFKSGEAIVSDEIKTIRYRCKAKRLSSFSSYGLIDG